MTQHSGAETGAETGAEGLRSRRYRRLLSFAAAAVLWERLWPRLWPAVCVLGTFLAIALMDVLPRLPHWLHAAVLAVFVVAFATALAWARPALRTVAHEAARTRLERDNRLDGRPLATLEDRLAAGLDDPLAQALWRRHRERMASMLRRLRVRLPRPDIARHEPWGVRAGVLLLLAIGLAAGYRDPAARLARALDPGLPTGGQPIVIELWITPPAHTSVSPIFLRAPAPTAAADGETAPIRVPRGSAVLARTAGTSREPQLLLGSAATPFSVLPSEGDGKQAWRAEATIVAGERIVVRVGRRDLASWPIAVLDDAPPRVAFAEPPAAGGDGLLLLAYLAEDDYGVVEVEAVIGPQAAPAPGGDQVVADAAAPIRLPLPLATPGAPAVAGAGLHDLSAHPLAGQPVRIRLRVKDAAGQVGEGEPADAVLPERTFSHPVARAVIGLRKRLYADPEEERDAVADELGLLAARPEHFANDVVVSLALAVGKGRLSLERTSEGLASVRDLLWETALRIEQGDVPFAERQVEEARRELMEALNRGAGEAEIERLMDALQQALDRYLAAAAAELARRGMQPAPLDGERGVLRSDDLHDLIETARQLARSGGRQGAMQMLAELQRMLDGIRSGLRSGQGRPDLAEAQALMKALRGLAERQQALLDQTFQRLREPRADGRPAGRDGERPAGRDGERRGDRPGGGPSGERRGDRPGAGERPGDRSGERSGERGDERGAGGRPGAGAGEQQALRRELGELMLRMGDFLGSIPAPLGEADQGMRGAVDALDRGRLADALPGQTRAADALSRALDAAGQAMAEKLGAMMALPGGEGDEGGEGAGDIFGRQPDGQRGFATGPLAIPDRASLQRAREILDELRRRAAERSRPRDELDYIERLLKTF